MGVTFEEIDNLPRRDLLPESMLDPVRGQLAVQHVGELSTRLNDFLENFTVDFAFRVCKHIEIVFNNNESLIV